MPGDYIDSVIFALDGDIAPFKARGRELDAEAGRMASSVRDKTKDLFKPATDSAAALEKEIDGLKRKISSGLWTDSDVSKLSNARKQLDALTDGSRKGAEAIKLHAHQVTNLSYQLQDFAVQVGSGGGFFRPFLQQAPQAADAVGGVTNAIKLLAPWAGPIGLGAIAVAMTAAAVATSENASRIRKELELTGFAAGVTAERLQQIAGGVKGTSFSGSEAALRALAGRGNVSSAVLPLAGQTAANMSLATGVSAGEAGKAIEQLLADPIKGAQDLEEQFNALTGAQQRQIAKLEMMGDRQGAQIVLLDAANARFKDAADASSQLTKDLNGAGVMASNFGRWLAEVSGRVLGYQTPEQERKRLEGNLNGPMSWAYSDAQKSQMTMRLNELRAQAEADAAKARRGETDKSRDDKFRAADAVSKSWDVAGTEAARRKEDRAATLAGLGAARASGNKEREAQYLADLKNLDNPNYKPGSGVPKGRTGVSRLSILGDTAAQELANAQQVAASPMRDRELVRARLAAELEYQRAIKQTGASEADAAKVRASRIGQAELAIKTRTADALTAMADETAAQMKLADAYGVGTDAAQAQTVAGQAHLAWLRGEITDEKAYADALNRRAFAQAAASTAQQISQQRTGNAGLGRLVAASGDPRALAAAQRENEALAATQAERSAARTKEEIELGARHLDQLRAEYKQRDDLQRQASANDNYARLREQLALSQADYDLADASASLRAREIADLQTILDLKREGWSSDDAGYQKELERRRDVNREIAALGVRKQLRDAAQGGIREGIDAALHGNFGELLKRKLYDAALDGLSKGITQALSKTAGSGGGGFWSTAANAAMAIFGGGKALGGDLDPSRYYVVGEKGPEILGPGVAGSITPMKAPNASAMAPAANDRGPMQINYAITVAGNGDAELLGRVHQVVNSTVSQAIQTNNAGRDRTLTARVQQANKRQLR